MFEKMVSPAASVNCCTTRRNSTTTKSSVDHLQKGTPFSRSVRRSSVAAIDTVRNPTGGETNGRLIKKPVWEAFIILLISPQSQSLKSRLSLRHSVRLVTLPSFQNTFPIGGQSATKVAQKDALSLPCRLICILGIPSTDRFQRDRDSNTCSEHNLSSYSGGLWTNVGTDQLYYVFISYCVLQYGYDCCSRTLMLATIELLVFQHWRPH